MAAQMKMMNYFMPIYSFFIVFFLPIGVGVYWIAGSVIRLVQQLIINHHFNKIDMAKLVKENEKKAAKKAKEKAEKKGVSGETIANAAKINTRQINAPKHRSITEKANSVSKSSSADTGQRNTKREVWRRKANKVREFKRKEFKIVGREKIWNSSKLRRKQSMMRLQKPWSSLGTTSDQIEYEVIEKGSSGFFGLNSKPAKNQSAQKILLRKIRSAIFWRRFLKR